MGIVIQNDGPKKGLVKIWVPDVSPSVYENWINVPTDKKILFPGLNLKSDISLILPILKNILPWSPIALPVSGEDSYGRYNAQKDLGVLSDGSIIGISNVAAVPSTPAVYNEDANNNIHDGFNKKDGIVNQVNPDAYSYNRNSYVNTAHGEFGIPNVGAKVWVFFERGNPLHPVLFAIAQSDDAWGSIYKSDAPGAFENDGKEISLIENENNSVHTSKKVISHKAGSIEFINTDGKEKVVIGHTAGSFKEMNNNASIEYNSGNKSELTNGDEFKTVKGDENSKTIGHKNEIIEGNNYKNIGNQNADSVNRWKQLISNIQEIKTLFDKKQADAKTSPIKITSTKQTKVGTPHTCPVCSSGKINTTQYAPTGYTSYVFAPKYPLYDTGTNPDATKMFGDIDFTGVIFTPQPVAPLPYPIPSDCPTCNGSTLSPSSQDGNYVTENLKLTLATEMAAILELIIAEEQKMGKGGSEIVNISKDKVENIGLVNNDFSAYRIDEKGSIPNVGIGIAKQGVFEIQKAKPLIQYVNPVPLPGGNYTINAANSFNVNAGAVGISLKTSGNSDLSSAINNINGLQINLKSKYEININAGERINISSDSIALKPTGTNPVLADGNFAVNGNVITKGSMHVGGELSVNHVSSVAEIQETQATTLYANGLPGKKLGTSYITIAVDNEGKVVGLTDAYAPLGAGSQPAVAGSTGLLKVTLWGDLSDDDSIKAPDHSHHFANLPLKLYKSYDEMRTNIRNTDSSLKNQINTIKHERKV